MPSPLNDPDQPRRERRRFGRIFQARPGGPWVIRYRVGQREHQESSGSTDRSKAERLLAKREAELGVPGAFTAPASRRTRYDELEAMLLDDYAMNGRKSTRQLQSMLKHVAAAFGGQRALTITADRLTRYVVDRLAAGAARATVQNELAALRRAFRLAKRAGKVAAVPEFPQLEIDNARQGFFEEADLRALLPALPEPLRAPTEFAYLTGWRKREILSLPWPQVDFLAGVVRLEPGSTKNKDGREFPFAILPPLKRLLERQRDYTRTLERRTGSIIPWVFHRDGQPIKDCFVAWKSAIDRAARNDRGVIVRPQLVGRLFHDLRRTAVRNLERAGVSRSVAMKLTGHKTEAVYRRYAIAPAQDLREGVAKLAVLHG